MPAKSKSQQRFFGMVHAVQKGEMEAPSAEVADVASDISETAATEFASTKHKGLPVKKKKKKLKDDAEKAACELLGIKQAEAKEPSEEDFQRASLEIHVGNLRKKYPYMDIGILTPEETKELDDPKNWEPAEEAEKAALALING